MVPGVGYVNFSAPRAAGLMLTAATQRAREADALRARVFRNARIVPTPVGREPHLRDADLFPFLQAAMAAVILGYTALDNFTIEFMPPDFTISNPKGGVDLSRADIEGRGLELRLSAVMAKLTGCENLMTAQPALWSKCVELKKRREALGHLKAAQAWSPSSLLGPDPATIWTALLSTASYEQEVVQVVSDVMDHYGAGSGFGGI